MGIINRFTERAKEITATVISAPFRAMQAGVGSNADEQRAALRLDRETRHVNINPASAAEGDKFSQDVITARHTATKARAEVTKRKKRMSQS